MSNVKIETQIGLYDPVLDDIELVYVPITQEEWQASNISEQTCIINQKPVQQNGTSNANVTKFAKTKSKETLDAAFHDQVRLNLKDAFPYISTEELPHTARYKLPISDEYDPEGKKMTKLRRLYEKVLKIDLRKVLEQMRHEENKTVRDFKEVRQDVTNKHVSAEKILKQNEMTKEVMYTEKIKKEYNTPKETAAKIVEKSINKALSVATEMKQKPKIELEKKVLKSALKIHEESTFENIKSFKESKIEEKENKTNFIKDVRKQDNKRSSILYDKKETKNVTFKDIEQEEMVFSKETENTETETDKLTTEKRKLLTKQDIEEVIEPGTVRNRTEIFKKYNIIDDIAKKSDYRYEKSDIKGREYYLSQVKQKIKMAQQRAYKIGAQTILNIQRATYPSYSKVLLKTFFSKFTKVMIVLSKFIKLKPQYYFSKQQEEKYYEQSKDERDFSKTIREGELIIKNKLSGAKIAQIEGMKPVELTDKMNIVILELQRMSGMEEQFDKKEFDKVDFNKTEFDNTEFDKKEFQGRSISGSRSKLDEDIKEAAYKHNTDFDNKQSKFHTYETTKTQSMEVREMRSEKRYSEYKSTKKESSPCNEMQTFIRDADGNIIYIAIVEAHVYTNKDAIFEENLRRLSETKKVIEITELNKQNDTLKSEDKMNIYVAFDDRKLSLANTAIIPVEEYSTVNEIENKQVKYIRSATDMEHLSKKIAVRNITQVIEPLLQMEANKYATSKYAHAELEIPVKSIAEETNVAVEENQMYFQAQVFVTQKSYMSIEKPEKPAIEITEISVDEDETGVLEEFKVKEEQPQPIIETPRKSIAETSEVLTNEDQIVEIVVPEPKVVQPSPTIETTAKSVAVTSEVLVDEASLEIIHVPKAITKTSSTLLEQTSMSVAETTTTSPERSSEFLNIASEIRKESATIDVSKNIATEVLQVSFEEPTNERIIITETKRRQSQPFVEESFLTIPETITTFIEEPKDEELIIQKPQVERAKIDISTNVAAEVLEISYAEKEQKTFDVPKVIDMKSDTSLEKTSFAVAEKIQHFSVEPRNEPVEEFKSINQKANLQVQEFNATEISIVYPVEPEHLDLEIKGITEKQSRTIVEETNLSVAETLMVLPEEKSNEIVKVPKVINQQVKIDIEELKAAEVITVSSEEPLHENLELPKIVEQLPQTLIESCVLTLPEALAILPEGPKVEFFSKPEITEKQSQPLVEETKFTVAESLMILPEESSKEIFVETITPNQQAIIDIVQQKAAEIITVSTEEPPLKNLEVPKIVEKLPQTLLESCVLTVPEALAILPEGPKVEYFEIPNVIMNQTKSLIETPLLTVAEFLDTLPEGPKEGGFEVTETAKEHTNIDLDGYKPLTTSMVFFEDQHGELELSKIDEKLPQTLMENPVLTVPFSLTVLPGGPKDEPFEIVKPTDAEPKVDFEHFIATAITIVSPEEPKQENLEISKVIEKIPQIEMEGPHHTLAEILAVIPDGPKEGNFERNKIPEEEIKVNFNELHSVETTSVSLGESIKDNLPLSKIIEKQPQVKIQEMQMNIPETITIIPEEPKDQAFNVTKIINQEARINVEELKAAETKITSFEEIANEKFYLPEVVKKQSQRSSEICSLAVAETLTTSSIESATEFTDAQMFIEKNLKSVEKNVNVTLETMTPVAQMTITSVEETHDLSAKLKSSTQTANVALVESSAAMVAETTAVTVAKEEAFKTFEKDTKVKITEIPMRVAHEAKSEDIELNYTVELPKDEEVNEVFAEITLTKQKTPPVEVFAEFEFNEKKTEIADIFESIKLLKKQGYTQESMDACYTALITDVEIEKKVEEELLQLLQSSKIEVEYLKSGDISYFTFPSPTLIPIIQEYMFRLMGPSLRRFQYMGDVFEEATLKLKSKFQRATVQNFDASLNLTLQDIAISQLQSEVINVDMESMEYVSEKDVSSMQYFDSKKMSRSVEASVQSSEMQSLHTGVAIANAATKQTIETGIDVSVLAIEQKPIIESSRKIATQKKKKSMKSVAMEAESLQAGSLHTESFQAETMQAQTMQAQTMQSQTMQAQTMQAQTMQAQAIQAQTMQATSLQAESKSIKAQSLSASHSQAIKSEGTLHAQSLNAGMEISMQQNLSSMEMSQIQQSELQMSGKSKHMKSKKSSASLEANYIDQESLESSISMSMAESDRKLAIKTDLTAAKSEVLINGVSLSPPMTPPTPLTDEYVFKLEIPLPHISEYVQRDCSYSPEIIEDDIILKCGLIPHIITRIERIIYCPPLLTPPVSPEKQIIPIYRKPVLKGGSGEHKSIGASIFKFFC